MNIFDLVWCKFYLHHERYDIGYPLLNASTAMTFVIEIYIVDLIIFPSTIGFYKLPTDVSFLPFGIGYSFILAIFLFRYRKKDIRNKILEEYREYKKEHPRKSTFRFIMFIVIPILLFITCAIIMNTRYNMLHGA
jgi:hypothetical protein